MAQVNKYNHSKIYKICSDLTDKIYIGSTTQTLSHRLRNHTSDYRQYINTNNRYVTSFEIIKLGDYYITLIEEHNYNNKQQLFKREGEVMKLNTNVVNKVIAGRTDAEYYNDNHETILEKKKQYRQDNKELISEYKKQHYSDHKQVIAERDKQYKLNNKEVIAEYRKQTFTCECCLTITKHGKAQHIKTPKHINLIQQLFNNELNHYNF